MSVMVLTSLEKQTCVSVPGGGAVLGPCSLVISAGTFRIFFFFFCEKYKNRKLSFNSTFKRIQRASTCLNGKNPHRQSAANEDRAFMSAANEDAAFMSAVTLNIKVFQLD